MLKCNIKKGRCKNRIKANGTAEELVAYTLVLIQKIYQSIHEKNPAASEGYKLHLIGTLLDPDSPVWKEDAT